MAREASELGHTRICRIYMCGDRMKLPISQGKSVSKETEVGVKREL